MAAREKQTGVPGQLLPRPPLTPAPHGAAVHGGRRLHRASAPDILETVGESEEGGECGGSSSSEEDRLAQTASPTTLQTALATPEGSTINRAAFRRGWRPGSVHDHFVWDEGDELGRGAFGRVFFGKSRFRSGQRVAVKELSMGTTDDTDKLWSEIAILSELDHPHVLRFLEAYEDMRNIYVVTEVCLGGTLSSKLEAVQGNSRFAARVAQEVVGALAHCHARGVCHRDLKLDNILLVRDSIESPVRVADFGLARRTSKRIVEQRLKWARARQSIACCSKSGTPLARVVPPRGPEPRSDAGVRYQRRLVKVSTRPVVCFTSCAGTPEYMAPEVMRVLDAELRSREAGGTQAAPPFYDFRCDVWSLAVVVHVLLTGGPPYALDEVGAYVSEGTPLPPLPEAGTEGTPPLRSLPFLARCLVPDFRERASAEELLHDPWIAPESAAAPTPSAATDLARRLQTYARLSRFKRAALLASVRHLNAYEYEQLRTLFSRVDTDNSGSLTVDKLREALQRMPTSPSCGQHWIEDLAKKLDSEQKGQIDFTDFLAAVMDPRIEDRPELARAAFSTFDLDGDGMLSKSELEYILENFSSRHLSECCGWDAESKELSFEGFVSLLRCG